ncbi:MAG: hypothetical protein WD934_10140 [Gemmatimonadales bacterium]
MSEKLGVIEFFAMEAGEYLEQLDGLITRSQDAPGDEFPRLTRSLRGAALMANQQPIAQVAQALEQIARAVHGGRAFDAGLRQLTIRAVDDLKILVRGVRAWTDELGAKATALTRELEQAGGGRPSQIARAVTVDGPDAGTRAFVAREGATLATALDRAAKLLHQQPGSATLQPVLNALQPLRGVAGLADLPPMAELLDGVERAVAEGSRPERADAVAIVLDAAAKALSEATRAIATSGKADADGDHMRTLASALAKLLEFDQPVVPIASLFFSDAGPHIVQQGTAPAGRQQLGEVELVSHGEHLRQVADTLDRTDSATRRTLRAHGLAGTLRGLEQAAGPVGDAALAFASAVRNAIAAGFPADRAADLARALRSAGQSLAAAASGNLTLVANGLNQAASQLGGAPAPATSPAPTAPPPSTLDGAGAAGAEDSRDLVGSYQTYDRYVAALGLGPASLDELLSGPPADPRRAAPVAATPAADQAVPIATLLYDGPAALDRARQLRTQAANLLAQGDHKQASALLEEVLDLVQIGLGR